VHVDSIKFYTCPTNAYNSYKIIKLLKSFKIIIVAPTCFSLHKPSSGSSQPVLRQIYNVDIGYIYRYLSGPGSSVGITAGRSGIESRWGREFPPVQTGPGAHPASCKMGTGSFPGVKCGRGVLLTTHPLLVPRSRKSRAIHLPTLWATPSL